MSRRGRGPGRPAARRWTARRSRCPRSLPEPAGLDLRVHADHLPGVVEQRAARVAGVDRAHPSGSPSRSRNRWVPGSRGRRPRRSPRWRCGRGRTDCRSRSRSRRPGPARVGEPQGLHAAGTLSGSMPTTARSLDGSAAKHIRLDRVAVGSRSGRSRAGSKATTCEFVTIVPSRSITNPVPEPLSVLIETTAGLGEPGRSRPCGSRRCAA